MCGGRSSILHYGSLIEINKLYAPTPNGQSVAKQKQYPPPVQCTGKRLLHQTSVITALPQRPKITGRQSARRIATIPLKYMIVKAI